MLGALSLSPFVLVALFRRALGLSKKNMCLLVEFVGYNFGRHAEYATTGCRLSASSCWEAFELDGLLVMEQLVDTRRKKKIDQTREKKGSDKVGRKGPRCCGCEFGLNLCDYVPVPRQFMIGLDELAQAKVTWGFISLVVNAVAYYTIISISILLATSYDV